jgi:hypothetical protein
MQIKTTRRFHLTPMRMAKIKKKKKKKKKKHKRQHMLVRIWSKGNVSSLMVGVQTDTTTLEINLVVSQKTGNSSPSRSSYTAPGHIPKRCSTI